MELEIIDITKKYKDFTALDKVNFEVKEGDVFGILGANGAGKTTLLRIITGILNTSSGSLKLKGQDLTYNLILKHIGYLPEERGLYKNMKAIDCLIFLASLKNINKNECINYLEAKKNDLEIDFDLNKSIGSFSKGMQQKIQLLAATVHRPSLLILDEPFSGLDPMNAQVFKKEIIRLSENGTTILMSTHRMDTFEDLCNSFLFLKKGKILAKGLKSELLPVQNHIELQTLDAINLSDYKIINYENKANKHTYIIEYSDSKNVLLEKLLQNEVRIESIKPHRETLEDIFIKMNKNTNE